MKDGDGIAELEVIDHGIGIDADTLPRLFERFRQAHGGSVTAFSAGPGTGATFTVRLPIAA